ncbi:ParA family protein [Sphingobacterium sp.]|uniref:ParA family protein n=1 Tax=Sphingobacterium sp. TaxID=341027 RepID=UPI002897F3F9|nr:ParA family protein [Sphingobacterium sp.]
MDTKKQPLFVAFSSQKGGVGKSTFTTLMASLLHYRLGYNVAVFDCDFPQHSLVQMRTRDMGSIMGNEVYKKLAHKQFTTINKKAYPILKHRADGVLDEVGKFLQSSTAPVDVVFFDLPGTVNSAGILKTLAGMHHIFTPIIADRVVMESTLVFTQVLNDVVRQQGATSIQSVNLFWNQVDGREKSSLYNVYEELIGSLGIHLMRTRITDSKRFRKEGEADAKTVFRSTLLPADVRLMKACRLDLFMDEFLRTVKL